MTIRKTISIPRNIGLMDLAIYPGQADAAAEVEVRDSICDPVATVAVYRDGSAETVWRTTGDTYASRDERWWTDLVEAVAKATPLRDGELVAS